MTTLRNIVKLLIWKMVNLIVVVIIMKLLINPMAIIINSLINLNMKVKLILGYSISKKEINKLNIISHMINQESSNKLQLKNLISK